MDSFYSEKELLTIGFKTVGTNVKISRKTSIYSPDKITIGDNVRIDDFCILSGNITFGNYIHIAASCLIFGGNDGVIFEDFSGLSSRVAIYAESDDYSGRCFSNPTLPSEYRHVLGGGVVIKKHAVIGTGCTILPNVVIEEGVAVGSMSMVNKPLEAWGVYVGIPCKRVKDRCNDVLNLEKLLHKDE